MSDDQITASQVFFGPGGIEASYLASGSITAGMKPGDLLSSEDEEAPVTDRSDVPES
ncbi:hypothetical protein [Nonomuraea bangladeshensis]|uniref:hypothetical protein n=1 Tax=Nonomuraea bangladeshensis TaxID=404385 RepID=UPI0031D714B2